MRRNSILKIVKIFTIICMVITLTCIIGNFGMKLILQNALSKEASSVASSVGIIGGADGPTAIFLATSSSPFSFTAFFGILTIIGLVFYITIKKRNNT